eukprot:scaffold3120_cov134-Pinguiococcus_pyrenoidosus.AAC.1
MLMALSSFHVDMCPYLAVAALESATHSLTAVRMSSSVGSKREVESRRRARSFSPRAPRFVGLAWKQGLEKDTTSSCTFEAFEASISARIAWRPADRGRESSPRCSSSEPRFPRAAELTDATGYTLSEAFDTAPSSTRRRKSTVCGASSSMTNTLGAAVGAGKPPPGHLMMPRTS